MSALAVQGGSAIERLRSAFEARARGDDALTALRRSAFERFAAEGFPTQRDDAWKYTNLRRLQARSFEQAGTLPPTVVTHAAAPDSRGFELDGLRIVLVDGHVAEALSTLATQPPGVTLLTLSQWARNDPQQVAELLAARQPTQACAFEELNTAFFQDGVILEVSPGATVDLPVHIVHQWARHERPHMSHPRIIIRAGAGSRISVVEHYVGHPDTARAGEHFTNAVTLVEVGRGAHVGHYRLQSESLRTFHVGTTRVSVQADGRYHSHDLALGGALARLNLAALLEGPGANVALHGLLLPDGAQHLDACTRIEHVAPDTASYEEYRGIAAGRGRGVFNGKVVVHPGAQRIDARQSSRNLLLSPSAEIDTRPELEIYANDVKCSHGATTGQLDAEALFYLRSRGLSEQAARAALIRAFAESVLDALPFPAMRRHLEQRLEERFAASAEADSVPRGA
ncbi:MAG: Fe-S cluster assembly protein SufD [Proteobacteria bacterium]|nr:MAG: Fe-S cluster assembly protein SufD [Pseudomonadota bacterium]